MTSKQHFITVNDLQVEVVRKRIKNLNLRIYPPHGQIKVSVPLAVTDDVVRMVVAGKLEWIKHHQAKFAEQPCRPRLEFLTGECHDFMGRGYQLNVIEYDGPGRAFRNDATIDLYVRDGADLGARRAVLETWYRQQLEEIIPDFLVKWEAIIGVRSNEWRLRKMRTRWGSCNIRERRIWLNLELAKKSRQCIEYVLVHELVHLLECSHNDRFKGLMDQFLPDWRLLRKELYAVSLKREDW